MMKKPILHKLMIGKVKQLGDPDAKNVLDRPWETGMFKYEKTEPIWLGKTSLQGDQVADTKNHGGPEKAIFAYPEKHYHDWRQELQLESIGPGAMGENLAVLEMDEDSVCIGDTYQLGEAIIQVSQPRRPCWKPGRRFKVLDFALRIQNTGRTGWYYRVLQEGYIKSGQTFELLERPYPKWTISACNDVMYVHKKDVKLAEELASCDLLAGNWKQTLTKRVAGQTSSDEERIHGPNRQN